MNTLSEYIKKQPERPMREWADNFGISRPHLIALTTGDRYPSVAVAKRIERETLGLVPVTAWPNIRAIFEAIGTSQVSTSEAPQDGGRA